MAETSENMKGPMTNKAERHCLPLEQRIRLYDETLQLLKQGLTHSQIIEKSIHSKESDSLSPTLATGSVGSIHR